MGNSPYTQRTTNMGCTPSKSSSAYSPRGGGGGGGLSYGYGYSSPRGYSSPKYSTHDYPDDYSYNWDKHSYVITSPKNWIEQLQCEAMREAADRHRGMDPVDIATGGLGRRHPSRSPRGIGGGHSGSYYAGSHSPLGYGDGGWGADLAAGADHGGWD